MKILMTMFGWNESNAGGGTRFPKQIAHELQANGHEVMVFYSLQSTKETSNSPLHYHTESNIQLVGYQYENISPFFWGLNPSQDIQDDNVCLHFQKCLDDFMPDIVHFHNFLGLSVGLNQLVSKHSIPCFYSPYNYWLICPTLNLFTQDGTPCQGVNQTGSNCMNCVKSPYLEGHHFTHRRKVICQTYTQYGGKCLATSNAVKSLLIKNGYQSSQIDVLLLGNERASHIWQKLGKTRQYQIPEKVHFGFMGAHVSIKGLETLVEATQLLKGDFKISLYGSGNHDFIQKLKQMDGLQRIQFCGRFKDEELVNILSQIHVGIVPSICYDHSPLVISEFQAAKIPVIGSNMGGIPDYLQPNTGRLFEAQNPQALAKIMQQVIDSPELISHWQSNIHPPLSFEDYVRQLEGLYQKQTELDAPLMHKARIKAYLKKRSTYPHNYYQLSALPQQSFRPLNKPTCCHLFIAELLPSMLANQQTINHLSQAQKLFQFDSQQPFPQLQPSLQSKLIQLPEYIPNDTIDNTTYEIDSDKSFRLLTTLNIHSKSSIDIIKTYLEVFSHKDDICLVIIPDKSTSKETHEYLIHWFSQHKIQTDQMADILILELEISQNDRVENSFNTLLNSCHGLWLDENAITSYLIYLAIRHLMPIIFPHSNLLKETFIELHETKSILHPYLTKLKENKGYQIISPSNDRIEHWNQQIIEIIYQEILRFL